MVRPRCSSRCWRGSQALETLDTDPAADVGPVASGWLSVVKAMTGTPPDLFPIDLYNRVTMGAVVDAFRSIELCDRWVNTLDYAAVFPLVNHPEPTSPLDTRVDWIVPTGVAQYPSRTLAVGVGMRLVCGESS